MEVRVAGVAIEEAALIFVRLLAFMMTAPVFRERAVVPVVKIGLAAGITYALMAARPTPEARTADFARFLLAMMGEMIAGALIGFASLLALQAIEIAGAAVGMEMGLSFPASVSPLLPSQGTVVEQWYMAMATLFFLLINGHHSLLFGFQRTLDALPPGAFVLSGLAIDRLIAMTSTMFTSAIQIALPLMATLIFTDLALALISRMIAQIPVFVLGMPIKIAVGLVALIVTWPLMLPTIVRVLQRAADNVMILAR